MDNLIFRSVVGCLLLFVSIFIFSIFHSVEGGNLAEIGYMIRSKGNKSISTKQGRLDKLLYWSFCVNAKYNKSIVWVYFFLNILSLLGLIGSIVMFIVILAYCDTLYETIVYQLGYLVACVEMWAIIHFVLDIFFLPSQRKRYGVNKKSKNKKSKR